MKRRRVVSPVELGYLPIFAEKPVAWPETEVAPLSGSLMESTAC